MHTLIFLDLSQQLSIFINNAVPNIYILYIILISSLIIVNWFIRKLKFSVIFIINLVILFGMYKLSVSPYTKGEKLNYEINCAKEYINNINEHIKLSGHVPDYDQIDEIEKPACLQNVKTEYIKIYIGDENQTKKEKSNDPTKEFSYKLLLHLPEFKPDYIQYTEFKNEFMIQDD